MNLFVSVLPIVLPFFLLVVLQKSAKFGMTVSFLLVLILSYVQWGMELDVLLASSMQGLHKALGILLILFGATFMMNVLKLNGAINRINIGFDHLTEDMRIQAVLIAYLFGGLIEGVAGFGTPAVVVAPLLVALGFSPISSATIALVSNSVTVPFAAVGTPVQVGLGNIDKTSQFFNSIAHYITSIEFLAGTLMPTIIVVVFIYFFGKNKEKKDYLEIIPWTLFIGISYSCIAFLVARTLGFEFVTIVTILVMLLVSTVTIKLGFLVPKTSYIKPRQSRDIARSDLSLIVAWAPYGVVITLLVLSRVIAPVKEFFLHAVDLSWNNILGISGVNSSLNLLYSPGFVLIVSALIGTVIQRQKFSNFTKAMGLSLGNVKGAALALIPTLAMVQIFSNSGMNMNELSSMPIYLAKFLGDHLHGYWIFIASYVGEMGSFITGSATVSALTFSPIQHEIAIAHNMNVNLILSLGLLGGAAGNMICVHNVVSVCTVVNVEGSEGLIIKKTIIPALLYAFLVGLSAFVLFG